MKTKSPFAPSADEIAGWQAAREQYKVPKKRPPLSAAAARGLAAMRSLASAELEAGQDGAFHPRNGGAALDSADVAEAIAYLDALFAFSVSGRT